MFGSLFRLAAVSGVAASLLTGCASGATGGDSPGPHGPEVVAMPTGCGTAGPVVAAVAGHANAPLPVLTARSNAAVDVAVRSGAAIGVVSVEGRPALVQAGRFRSDAQNATARQVDETAFRRALTGAVGRVRAVTPGVNDLGALQVSADAVRAACPRGGTVSLTDPGLSDRGALNFAATDLLTASPHDVVSFLRRNHALPDLADMTVILDVGQVAPPQQQLTVAALANLRAIWAAVARTSGARQVVIDTAPVGRTAPAGVPAVSRVRVPADPIFRVKQRGATSITLPDSGPVGFVPDRAEFRDPIAARATLRHLAAALAAVPGARLTLVGTTSSAGGTSAAAERGRVALSRARASAVAEVLIAARVPASSIVTRGVGTRFAQFERDTDADGNLLPVPAAHNRSVRVAVVAG